MKLSVTQEYVNNEIALENKGMTNSNTKTKLTTGQGYDFFF